MAKYSIEDTTLTAIGDAIRDESAMTPTPIIGALTPQYMIDYIPRVCSDRYGAGWEVGYNEGEEDGYNTGYWDGEADGYNVGYAHGESAGYPVGYIDGQGEAYPRGVADGIQSEYDRFWDAFQQNGTRTIYASAFGVGWTADIFKPKYPIQPISAYMMFYNNVGQRIEIPDFVTFCTENNVVLDFSQCTSAQYALGCLWTNHHGTLDFSKCTALNYLFYSQNNNDTATIKTIDEFKSSATTVYHTTTFQGATSLESIRFSGVIANSIWFDTCTKLTKESIISIFGALSTTATGKTLTLSMTAVDKAFETSPGANDGRSSEEFFLIANDRLNWIISFI